MFQRLNRMPSARLQLIIIVEYQYREFLENDLFFALFVTFAYVNNQLIEQLPIRHLIPKKGLHNLTELIDVECRTVENWLKRCCASELRSWTDKDMIWNFEFVFKIADAIIFIKIYEELWIYTVKPARATTSNLSDHLSWTTTSKSARWNLHVIESLFSDHLLNATSDHPTSVRSLCITCI